MLNFSQFTVFNIFSEFFFIDFQHFRVEIIVLGHRLSSMDSKVNILWKVKRLKKIYCGGYLTDK